MSPREFWWLYEWKTRDKGGKKKPAPLNGSDVRRLRNMMDKANAPTAKHQDRR